MKQAVKLKIDVRAEETYGSDETVETWEHQDMKFHVTSLHKFFAIQDTLFLGRALLCRYFFTRLYIYSPSSVRIM